MDDALFIVYRTKKFDRAAKKIWREKDIGKIVEDLSQNPEKASTLAEGFIKFVSPRKAGERAAGHGLSTC